MRFTQIGNLLKVPYNTVDVHGCIPLNRTNSLYCLNIHIFYPSIITMDPLHVPQRYIPPILSKYDMKKQKRELRKSRKLYKRGIYYQRKTVKSFHSKPSKHLEKAQKLYGIDKIKPSRKLSEKTKCSQKALEKIVNKGRGAYYSSGSRPNQTAESWGLARLASSITGGNASKIDYGILESGCEPNSPALLLAQKPKNRQ